MRITSKVLSVVLALCILFSTIGYAATYNDVSVDNPNYEAISLLSSLGIIKGYEDGTFGPDKNVTRAEFTVMLMRTLNLSNLGSTDLTGLPFTDLEPVKDWAVSDIRTAYDLGIINGMDATTFAPSADVTHEQALKMIVCAMGYEPMAIDFAGGKELVWPFGYTTVATQLSLTSGVTADYTTPAKRADIAKYIFNALEVDLMVSKEYPNGAVKNEIVTGVNILNDKLRVIVEKGELLADTDSTILDSGSIARAGELVILPNGSSKHYVFKNDGISTKGLVGRNIEYYYTEDFSGVKTLIHIVDSTKSTSVLEIEPDDLNNIDGSWAKGLEVSYWANENDRNPTSIKLDKNPTVSVNGRVIDIEEEENSPLNVFMVDSGSIELVDTTNDGLYNKVNIQSYITYVVNTKATTPTKKISDLHRKDSIELNDEDSKTTINMTRSTNGSTVTFSSLKKYDVLSIKKVSTGGSKTTIDVIVSSESVKGAVTSIDLGANEIEIDNKTYKFSNYIINFAPELIDTLNINDTCKFYLDKDDRIASFEKVESDNQYYAYLCGVAAYDDTVEFKVIDKTGKKDITMYGANRIKIDGKTYSDAETIATVLYDVMYESGGNVDGKTSKASQLAKITKNSAGEISVIDTIAEYESETDLELAKSASSGDKYKYSSSTKSFSNGSDSFYIDSNTIIFTVPSEREKYTEYAKRTVTYFKDKQEYDNFEVYDLGEGRTAKAKCLVLYGKVSTETLNSRSPLFIVETVSKAENSSGTSINKLTGYLFGEDVKNSEEIINVNTTTSAIFKDALAGDVYRISYSGSSFSSSSKEILSVEDEDMTKSFYEDFGSKDEYVVLHGLLVSKSDEVLVIAETNDIDDLVQDYINSEDKDRIDYTVDTYDFAINEKTLFVEVEKGRNNDTVLVSKDNNLGFYQAFEDFSKTIKYDEETEEYDVSSVDASEILIYVIDDEPVFIYKVTR